MDTVRYVIFFLGGMTLSFIIFALLMIICELLEDVLRKRPSKLLEVLFRVLAFLSYIFMFGGLILWFFVNWLSKENAKDEVAKARGIWYQMLENEQKTSKQVKVQLALAEEKIEQMEIKHSNELNKKREAQSKMDFIHGYSHGYYDGCHFCQAYFEVEPENEADFERRRSSCCAEDREFILRYFEMDK